MKSCMSCVQRGWLQGGFQGYQPQVAVLPKTEDLHRGALCKEAECFCTGRDLLCPPQRPLCPSVQGRGPDSSVHGPGHTTRSLSRAFSFS